jgi:ureidoglycolate lyase
VVIHPEPLTREAFLSFGEVIELTGQQSSIINYGNTEKFADLARLISADHSEMVLHYYRSQPAEMPFLIEKMECHPLGSQAFFPLHDRPFPVVVALPDTEPHAQNLRVFLSNGRQGINLMPGVWHHYQISLEQECDYLVVDRKGEGNFREVQLTDPVTLQI